MLRGQETLTRLIGKRRRLDLTSIFSHLGAPPNELRSEGADLPTLTPGHCSDLGATEASTLPFLEGVTACKKRFEHSNCKKENLSMDLVQCPVCGKDIQGNDTLINSHLDLCLLGRTKGKNNQLTLLHFTKVPTSKLRGHKTSSNGNKDSLYQSTTVKIKRVDGSLSIAHEKRLTSKSYDSYPEIAHGKNLASLKDTDFLACEKKFEDSTIAPVTSKKTLKQQLAASMEKLIDKEESNFQKFYECNCCCHSKTITSEGLVYAREQKDSTFCNSHIAKSTKDSVLAGLVDAQRECHDFGVMALETWIVGRKFNRSVNVEKGMKIRAKREPENPKDPNAIKIIGPEDEGGLAIGHLSWDLAVHLSALLDNGFLNIEGFIESVPEKAFEPVPIKLLCERRSTEKAVDADFFRNTWDRVQQIVKENGSQQLFHPVRSKYLQNFSYFVKTALERDSHLFTEEELAFLGSFFSLTENAQRLFVRLYQRKGPWFRVSQINYADISNLRQASDELLGAGFVTHGDFLEEGCFENAIRERMHVLSVSELKQLISMGHWKRKKINSGTTNRDELLDWIICAANEKHRSSYFGGCSGEAVLSLVLKMIGFCIRVSEKASFLLWRLQRLFFLNGEQDVSSFLLVDMGKIKYPTYTCSQTRKVFATRDTLLAYEQALEVAQAMDMSIESNDQKIILHCLDKACMGLSTNGTQGVCAKKCERGDVFLARFTALWVYATVVTLGVSVLEREHRYIEAVELLKQLIAQSCCPGRRGYWTVRLSIDLEHLGRKEDSLEVAEAGLNDPRIRNGDRVALQRRVLRLGKPPRRWKKPPYADALARSWKEVFIRGRPLNCKTGVKSRFYGFDGQQCSVEELALQYYAGESGGGWQGVHSESGVWMTLFALLMWDILFADIPNVFWHPFQSAPLDLSTDAFYPEREAIIEAQLSKIHHGEAAQILAGTWSKRFGTLCKGLNWERHSLEELLVIVSCVGGPGLASVCRLLAEDHAGWAGGMPDLLLWRVPESTPKPCRLCSCRGAEMTAGTKQMQPMIQPFGEAKLVEVKGPRDRLSEQQRAWIFILMAAGLQVEVCKVLEEPKSQDM